MPVRPTPGVPTHARRPAITDDKKPAADESKKIAKPDSSEIDETTALTATRGKAAAQQPKEAAKYQAELFQERIPNVLNAQPTEINSQPLETPEQFFKNLETLERYDEYLSQRLTPQAKETIQPKKSFMLPPPVINASMPTPLTRIAIIHERPLIKNLAAPLPQSNVPSRLKQPPTNNPPPAAKSLGEKPESPTSFAEAMTRSVRKDCAQLNKRLMSDKDVDPNSGELSKKPRGNLDKERGGRGL